MLTPGRIARLPYRNGEPVPWFVAWIGGEPDFRMKRLGAVVEATQKDLCWVCGVPFMRQEDRVFLVGPACAINRVASDPPCHLECAEYSTLACRWVSGQVVLLWVSSYKRSNWQTYKDPEGVWKFKLNEPKRYEWHVVGRQATRAEALEELKIAMPVLAEAAEAEGPQSMSALLDMYESALTLLPKE